MLEVRRTKLDAPSPRLLDLDYGPAVPRATLARMERLGKRLGLAMETLELLGQDEELCEAFVRAAERGGARLARLVDFARLRDALRDHGSHRVALQIATVST